MSNHQQTNGHNQENRQACSYAVHETKERAQTALPVDLSRFAIRGFTRLVRSKATATLTISEKSHTTVSLLL